MSTLSSLVTEVREALVGQSIDFTLIPTASEIVCLWVSQAELSHSDPSALAALDEPSAQLFERSGAFAPWKSANPDRKPPRQLPIRRPDQLSWSETNERGIYLLNFYSNIPGSAVWIYVAARFDEHRRTGTGKIITVEYAAN